MSLTCLNLQTLTSCVCVLVHCFAIFNFFTTNDCLGRGGREPSAFSAVCSKLQKCLDKWVIGCLYNDLISLSFTWPSCRTESFQCSNLILQNALASSKPEAVGMAEDDHTESDSKLEVQQARIELRRHIE